MKDLARESQEQVWKKVCVEDEPWRAQQQLGGRLGGAGKKGVLA